MLLVAHRSPIRSARRAIQPHIDAPAGILCWEQPHIDIGPAVARQIGNAESRAADDRRRGAGRARCHLREEARTLAERPRLDLEKGARAAILAVFGGILLDLVDDGAARLAPPRRAIARPVARHLEGKAVPNHLAEPDEFAGAARAVGVHLNLGPLGWRLAAWLGLHLGRTGTLGVADIGFGQQDRLACCIERVTVLDDDAANRLADGIGDDGDPQIP